MQDLKAEQISFSSQLQLAPEAQNLSATTTWGSYTLIPTKAANRILLRNYTIR